MQATNYSTEFTEGTGYGHLPEKRSALLDQKTASEVDERVELELHCIAQRVYVLIGGLNSRGTAVHRMQMNADGVWRVQLSLTGGCYRYRYYVDDGRSTTYFRPQPHGPTPLRMDGMDALLIVPSRIAAGLPPDA